MKLKSVNWIEIISSQIEHKTGSLTLPDYFFSTCLCGGFLLPQCQTKKSGLATQDYKTGCL